MPTVDSDFHRAKQIIDLLDLPDERSKQPPDPSAFTGGWSVGLYREELSTDPRLTWWSAGWHVGRELGDRESDHRKHIFWRLSSVLADSQLRRYRRTYPEGMPHGHIVIYGDRSGAARNACAEHYDYVCQACFVPLSKIYGPTVAELIHVHHSDPIKYGLRDTDPKDLITLCPNCHAVSHHGPGLQTKPLKVEEVRALIDKSY